MISSPKNNIWYPYTQHALVDLPVKITQGSESYLVDENNKRYVDMISSWWVNLHGHAHPAIARAIYQQAITLEHVIFSGFTHEPALQLANKLLEILPSHFSKIFYSDNGSTSIEVALKMAYQYWVNQNQPKRKRFIAFEGGYHGDTVGAMSVGKQSHFFDPYKELLFSVDFFPYPDTWLEDNQINEKETSALNKINTYLERQGDEVAALIIEPLIQGSNGMRICRPQFLQSLEKMVKKYQIIIIYDEVLTGFGRTGDLFACLRAKTNPDIICLAKGLTGGFLPLAVTACTEKIFETFLGNDFSTALAHGHSYSANPLACAAALASLNLLMEPETMLKIKWIEAFHREQLNQLKNNALFTRVRQCGTIAAFDLVENAGYGSLSSLKWRNYFLEKGFLIRPIGNVFYFLPPYCISEADLKEAYRILPS